MERERERDRLGLFGFGVVDKKKEVPYNCHERDAEEEEWRMMEGRGEGGPFAGHVTDGAARVEEDEDKEAERIKIETGIPSLTHQT